MLSQRVRRLPGLYESPSRLAVACAVGLVLALLTLALGPITLPMTFFGLFVLPWLMQDLFRLFIWLIVTWPLLTLFLRIPLPAGIPDITYERVMVLFCFGVMLLDGFVTKRRQLKFGWLTVFAGIYIGVQLSIRLRVMWSGGIGESDLHGLLNAVLVPIGMYLLTKNLLVSRSHLKWFLYALVIACLLICLTGLYEQAVGGRLFLVSTRLGGSELRYQWQDVPGGRAAGALANPAIYGATLGMGILAGICCLSHVKRKLTRAALVATIGVLLYGVFASYTRSAWLSVFTVLFVAQFLVSGLWKRTLPIFMLGLLLMVLMWDELSDSTFILQRAATIGTITKRLALIHLAWERFLERPFLGWGSGALNAFSLRQVGETSHSIYLTFLVDGGLALFLSFSAVVGYILIRAIRVYGMTEKSSLERNIVVAMMGSVLIFLLSGLALELRYFGYFNALFWICAGVIDRLGARCTWIDHPD